MDKRGEEQKTRHPGSLVSKRLQKTPLSPVIAPLFPTENELK